MLTIDLSFYACEAASQIRSELEREGDALLWGHDFTEFQDMVREADRGLTEHFSIQHQTFSPSGAFWLMLCRSGVPVSTVAARLDLLGPMTLAAYWSQYLPRVYYDDAGHSVELDARQAAFPREASGRVVYLGEMWVAKSHQGRGVASLMARLVQVMSMQIFDPDNVYCWMRPKQASGGFPQACGFREIVPQGIRWTRPPAAAGDLSHLWLAGNRRSALDDLVRDLASGILSGASTRSGAVCPPLSGTAG